MGQDAPPLPLETDSQEYDLLEKAAKLAPRGPDLLWLEIGTREGGSTEILLNGMDAGSGQTLVSVDPYGGIPYLTYGVVEDGALQGGRTDGPISWGWISGFGLGYDAAMRERATVALLHLAGARGLNFVPFLLEDVEFMERFHDGVPVYRGGHKQLLGTYGLVFLDGPHDTPAVLAELAFFVPRLAEEGLIIMDDWLPAERMDFWNQVGHQWGLRFVAEGDSKVVFRRGVYTQDGEGLL